ncbi:hypothetical protein ACFU3J_35185 [Streptomyces sp. NPDC057411]
MHAPIAAPRRARGDVWAGALLSCRRHVDFCRTASAICPSAQR